MPTDEDLRVTPTTLGTLQPVTSQAVQEQLQRLIESPLFNHSRRYPSFLSYVVERALEGHGEDLKERTIGIEVFGRVPDYDLSGDPVVRQTAGEVRKRLAQYYYEPQRREELRIELHPGSYIPEFKLAPGSAPPAEVATPTLTQLPPSPPEAAAPPSEPPVHGLTRLVQTPMPYALLALVLLLAGLFLAGLLGFRAFHTSTSSVDHIWQPVLGSSAPILISVGSWSANAQDTPQVSIGAHAKSSDPVALADTVTAARLQQLLSQHGRTTVIQTSTQTSFSDLQRGTTILVAGFDNQWTMRLIEPLRFHFVTHPNDVLGIEDRENPGRTAWMLDTQAPYSNLSHDFAIVARFHDSTTEQLIIVAAGIGENGTLAAGQFLSDEKVLEAASPGVGKLAAASNMEAVLETQVIQGKSGPPRIVAFTTW